MCLFCPLFVSQSDLGNLSLGFSSLDVKAFASTTEVQQSPDHVLWPCSVESIQALYSVFFLLFFQKGKPKINFSFFPFTSLIFMLKKLTL